MIAAHPTPTVCRSATGRPYHFVETLKRHVYVPTTCLPHTGFAGVWIPATHAVLNSDRTIQTLFAAAAPAAHLPGSSNGGGGSLLVKEMRHVVDFFSVTFGLCGITQPGSALCDFTPQVRQDFAM